MKHAYRTRPGVAEAEAVGAEAAVSPVASGGFGRAEQRGDLVIHGLLCRHRPESTVAPAG